jgi:hypothetical protein
MSSKLTTRTDLLETKLNQGVVQKFTRLQTTDIGVCDIKGAGTGAVTQNAGKISTKAKVLQKGNMNLHFI